MEFVTNYETVTGMFQEHVHDLRIFKDKEGNSWEEFVQFEPWSSGPMIFLGLRRCNDHSIFIGWKESEHPTPQEFDRSSGTMYV